MGLLELAERCEQASGPDRELDLALARVQRVVVLQRNDDDTANVETTHWHYTASIDAALTLVNRYGVLLHLSDIGADGLPLCNVGDCETGREFKGVGTANLALAVCAAALRIRAATT